MNVRKKIIVFVLLILLSCSYHNITIAQDSYKEEGTTMYFLSVVTKNKGQGDCILLENNGKFGLIDTGDSTTKNQVIEYLKEKGVKQLEFMLITHCHFDHMGAAIPIMQAFPIKTLYIKEYNEDYVVLNKGHQTTYDNIVKLAQTKKTKIIGVPQMGEAFNQNNTKITFGTAKMQILNWETKYNPDGTRKEVNDENENSLGILITQGKKKAFLAGDMNDILGDETRLAPVIGTVDFLKLAHHGYVHSNTEKFLQTLRPEHAVITNDYYKPYAGTIKLLEQLQTKYHYSTQDEKAVIVNMSNNKVEVKYEQPNGWKFIMGSWRHIKNGVEIVGEQKEEITASNWEELYQIIATGKSKIVELKNSGKWIANKKITISDKQQITLIAEEQIDVIRAENYKETLLQNEGVLDIGIENMTGSITIDGNKQKVNAEESLLKNTGILNLSNKTTLKNNKLTDINKENGSAITSTGLYNQVNLLGGTIEGNEVDTQHQFEIADRLTQEDVQKGVYGGAIFIQAGTLNVVGGEIKNNIIDNHSTITLRNSKIKELRTTTYGGAILGTDSTVNLIGVKLEHNTCNNHSNINIQNSSIDYVNATARGGAISISQGEVNGNNYTTIKNNQAQSNTRLTKNNSQIEMIDTENSKGGGIYAYKSTIQLEQVKIIQNQATIGGGIFLAGTKLAIENAHIEQNQAGKEAGGINIDGSSNCQIKGGYLSGNQAKNKGNGIYQMGELEIGENININDNIYVNSNKTIKVNEKLTSNTTINIQYPTYRENQVIMENNTNQDILSKIILLGQNQYQLQQNKNQIILTKAKPKPTTITIQYSTKELTNTAVTIVIRADRELQEVKGWKRTLDKKQISKTFVKNTNESIQIVDSLGRKKEIPIEVNNIYQVGDINQDQKINVTDLLLLKTAVIMKNDNPKKDLKFLASDIDQNGNINATDLLLLKTILVKK